MSRILQSGYGAPGGTPQIYSASASANKNMPPPPPGPSQPRRHPDFAKDQQYPQYNQQRPAYPGQTLKIIIHYLGLKEIFQRR